MIAVIIIVVVIILFLNAKSSSEKKRQEAVKKYLENSIVKDKIEEFKKYVKTFKSCHFDCFLYVDSSEEYFEDILKHPDYSLLYGTPRFYLHFEIDAFFESYYNKYHQNKNALSRNEREVIAREVFDYLFSEIFIETNEKMDDILWDMKKRIDRHGYKKIIGSVLFYFPSVDNAEYGKDVYEALKDILNPRKI